MDIEFCKKKNKVIQDVLSLAKTVRDYKKKTTKDTKGKTLSYTKCGDDGFISYNIIPS